jgi:hypothetical protein
MTPIVRTVGIGRCSLLGELIDETETRYFYRRRGGHALAFVEKRSPVIHLVPCKAMPGLLASSSAGSRGKGIANEESACNRR